MDKNAMDMMDDIIQKPQMVRTVGPIRMAIMFSALVVLVGTALWYAFPKEKSGLNEMTAPILRADVTPYKVVPEDRGGMEIPHMDSTIYETLQARKQMERQEQLLPPTETPFPKDKIFAQISPAAGDSAGAKDVTENAGGVIDITDIGLDRDAQIVAAAEKAKDDAFIGRAQSEKTIEDIIVKYVDVSEEIHAGKYTEEARNQKPAVIDLTEEMGWDVDKKKIDIVDADAPKAATDTAKMTLAKEKQELATATVKPLRKPVTDIAMAKILAKRVKTVEPAAGRADIKAPQESLMGLDYRIQLGSLRSEESARSLWQSMQTKFPQQLSSLNLYIQRVDLGERGMYFRVQGGPLEQVQARAICDVIESRQSGGCLVIRR